MMNIMMKSKAQSIPEVLHGAKVMYGEKTAYSCFGQDLTYNEVDRLSDRFASFIQVHTSLNVGDRVAVQLPNILQYPVVVHAIMKAGMVLVNVNPQYTARELRHQLADSGARAVVVLEKFCDVLEEVIEQTDVRHVIVTKPGDLVDFPKGALINWVTKHINKDVPSYRFDSCYSFKEAMILGKKQPSRFVSISTDQLALIQYTGGTTGVSKGAMLTHGNLIANMGQVSSKLTSVIPGSEIFIGPLPMYHIYAFQFHILVLPSCGAQSVLIPDPRDGKAFISTLEKYPFTGLMGINTLFNSLCQSERFQRIDFSAFKFTTSGGMSLTEDVYRRWKEVTGCEIHEGFGMTESSPVVCMNTVSESQFGTVGRALPETSIKIIDDKGLELPSGGVGELCIKGPQVMTGYWNRPDETAQTLSEEGWLRTGDVALCQADGFIKIVDRLKDMIIVSGFNVYPNEVEDVIALHPDVDECAVIGVQDEKSGETIKAFVVSKNQSLTPAAIIDHCRLSLTAYKIPRIVVFTDDLPKSTVGKILRRKLVSA